MKKWVLTVIMVLLAIGRLGGSELPPILTATASCAAGECGDGFIDWRGRDSDYLSSGSCIYYKLWIEKNKCCRIIIELDVPWGADFDLYLVQDTSPPYCELDGGDRVVCRSTQWGNRVDERIDCCLCGPSCYFIIVCAYSGSGWYDIGIGLDC